jgi:site-specific recombinase XerD
MIMNKHFTEFNELTNNAGNYLEQELCYALKTSDGYRRVWKQVREFMFSNGINHYSKSVERQFLQFKFKNKARKDLTVNQRTTCNGLKMLTEYYLTGKINVPSRPSKYPLDFRGSIGKAISSFLSFKQQRRMSRSSLHNYQRHLYEFMEYCEKRDIGSVGDIDLPLLLHFINQYDCDKKSVIIILISTLRIFLQYLFKENLTAIDYSSKIPRCKRVTQPKIPSLYSKEEVERLIASVDRSSPTGKRNFAIIILAARLGLRASDISRLKFENLHWNTNTIEIDQVKTGKPLQLPLLPDVGNAIIDYLQYGRPVSEEPYVFLTRRPPYGCFTTSNVVTHVVQRGMIKAGINTKNRRFGPHSLRHSLGFRMLENSTMLPVISEVFGHKSSESTRFYLRIDLTSMKQCMLDVPPVPTEFYQQRGGAFYG